jgi:hypothetical protein
MSKPNYISPQDLINHLDVAPRVEMEFNTESKLEQYRRLLYSINGQKKHRFSTRRVYRRGADRPSRFSGSSSAVARPYPPVATHDDCAH